MGEEAAIKSEAPKPKTENNENSSPGGGPQGRGGRGGRRGNSRFTAGRGGGVGMGSRNMDGPVSLNFFNFYFEFFRTPFEVWKEIATV